ncbi:TetR family transcriptional regulator C-terminal domain-containing protein [Aquimarina sp. 2201CG14-23]|uniref:TetR family transcriptional regulator C-terminal domain-containing protein n=1 Tax=Aquimarina mycalae TaxID=3040073 RepID=UPI0024781BAC|nr:TetR family transcriptional regulator C-terminal domain-containing protein [Aquimarina sp. 2201CG14-23]MDH7446891.1 TetR family transcriptional regulator C-terminal domain-containing protein [Aquimarina sp. 2201CG14-23]
MASSNKNQTIDSQYIITEYMHYVLENDSYPKSVYRFCKDSKIKEEDFYKFFGSLDSVNKGIWNTFFSTTIDAMNNNKEYEGLSSKDKMLTFFYTFFELLTLNRSYVLLTLQYHEMPLKNIGQLKGLRKHIKGFAKELIEVDNGDKLFNITKNPVSVYSEGAWFQFLFLLKFWMDDDSADFEKTDIAIEKSVNTVFDLFDNTPLTNVLDFGKFLWKEKTMWN